MKAMRLLVAGVGVLMGGSAFAGMGGLCFAKNGVNPTPDQTGFWWFDQSATWGPNWMIQGKQYPTEMAERFPALTDETNLNSPHLANPLTPLYIKDGDHAETGSFTVGMGRGGWSGGRQYFTVYGGTLTNDGSVVIGESSGTYCYGEGVVDFRAGDWTVLGNRAVTVGSGNDYNTRDSYGLLTIHENARMHLDSYKDKATLGQVVLGHDSNALGVITNMGYISAARIVLCPYAGTTSYLGEKALFVMRGGTVYASDAALTGRDSGFELNSLKIGGYSGSAVLRGWGLFDRGGNKNKGKENISISQMMGQVIADGEGTERDLDLGWFLSVNGGLSTDNANWSGTNGWYAVNKGRLIYPHRAETTSQTLNRVLGDGGQSASKVNRSYDNPSPLINTIHLKGDMKPTGTSSGTPYYWNTWAYAQLYASDRTDYPSLASVAPKSSHGKCRGVFRLGIFDHQDNTSTNPTSRRDFNSMNVKIRYDDRGLRVGRDKVTLYRYDDTNGWTALTTVDYDPENPYISAENLQTRATTESGGVKDAWNLGWFAVQSDREVLGMMLLFR